MYYACFNSNFEMCKILLENGSNPNTIETSNNETTVFRAMYDGNLDIIKLLTQYKFNYKR